jgi:hypothetical protein
LRRWRGRPPKSPSTRREGHAHNDYEHARPLLDALEQGFFSVEADIHLVDGKLLVAHDRAGVRPERTLEALYLEPLARRVKENGGQVYPGGRGFVLLVDIKTEAESTYAALDKVLGEVLRHAHVRPGRLRGEARRDDHRERGAAAGHAGIPKAPARRL